MGVPVGPGAIAGGKFNMGEVLDTGTLGEVGAGTVPPFMRPSESVSF